MKNEAMEPDAEVALSHFAIVLQENVSQEIASQYSYEILF